MKFELRRKIQWLAIPSFYHILTQVRPQIMYHNCLVVILVKISAPISFQIFLGPSQLHVCTLYSVKSLTANYVSESVLS